MDQGVICILQNSDGKTFFTKRSLKKKFLPGKWALPAGTVKSGETPEATVKRELIEEFGITAEEPILIEKKIEEEEGRGKVEKFIFKVKPKSSWADIRFNLEEADGAIFMTFAEFYSRYTDEEIGYILVWLRDKYTKFGFQ